MSAGRDYFQYEFGSDLIMGAELLGGLWAFEATISSIAAADFWNPVGWVLAIVAIVVIVVIAVVYVVEHWDDIVAFVEWAADGISSAWNSICEAATDVWEGLTGPEAVPSDGTVPQNKPLDVPIPIVVPIPIDVPIDDTKPKRNRLFNVYDVHVVIPGSYGDYVRGKDPSSVFLASGEIYKYGITSYGSVLRRYQAFQAVSPKELMILRNLEIGNFAPYEWYATRRIYEYARFIESGLITAYLALRGKLPPGNTGMY